MTEPDKVMALVLDLVGYSSVGTTMKESEIEEITGRDVEDVALDYEVERCAECGYWCESSHMNYDTADEPNGARCLDCAPDQEES